jgi:ketosteroid isomerase-like protein
MGEIPPTGQKIEQPFCLFVRVRDGKIVDSSEYYDAMTMMTQLGLMPEPAQASTI